jgi:hypothetical protein
MPTISWIQPGCVSVTTLPKLLRHSQLPFPIVHSWTHSSSESICSQRYSLCPGMPRSLGVHYSAPLTSLSLSAQGDSTPLTQTLTDDAPAKKESSAGRISFYTPMKERQVHCFAWAGRILDPIMLLMLRRPELRRSRCLNPSVRRVAQWPVRRDCGPDPGSPLKPLAVRQDSRFDHVSNRGWGLAPVLLSCMS